MEHGPLYFQIIDCILEVRLTVAAMAEVSHFSQITCIHAYNEPTLAAHQFEEDTTPHPGHRDIRESNQ